MYLYNATSSYTEQVFCSLNGLLKNCLGGTCKSSCIVPLDERITKRSEHSNNYWGLERKNLLHLLSIFWIMILPPSTHAVLASHTRKQRTGHEESCKIAHETGIELCEKSISNFCSYCAIWEITIKLAPQAHVVPMSHLSNCTYEKKKVQLDIWDIGTTCLVRKVKGSIRYTGPADTHGPSSLHTCPSG